MTSRAAMDRRGNRDANQGNLYESVLDLENEYDSESIDEGSPTAPTPRRFVTRFATSKTRIYSTAALTTLNIIIFLTATFLRPFVRNPIYDIHGVHDPTYVRAVAKNFAVITLVNAAISLSTIRRTSSLKDTRGQSIHEIATAFLMISAGAHATAHGILLWILDGDIVVEYIIDYAQPMISGVVLTAIILVITILSMRRTRKHNYTLFYRTHAVGFLLFAPCALAHSIGFACALVLPIAVLMQRLWLRTREVDLRVIRYGKTFVYVDLDLGNNFFTTNLLTKHLIRNNGRYDAWLTTSVLERHPFTAVKTYRSEDGRCHARFLISRFGDWKQRLYNELWINRQLDLYSSGVWIRMDDWRISDVASRRMLLSRNVLFVLENVGIASFLAYASMLSDASNSRLRDRARNIYVHFKCEDDAFLEILSSYADRLVKTRAVTLRVLAYTNNNVALRINESLVSRVIAPRMDLRLIVNMFLDSTGTNTGNDQSVAIYSNDPNIDRKLQRLLLERSCNESRVPRLAVDLL